MFKIGEKVRLVSGGPIMTVEVLHSQDMGGGVGCVWFDGTDAKRSTFPPQALERVP